MKNLHIHIIRTAILGVFVIMLTNAPVYADDAAVLDLAMRINRERITQGLVPYAVDAQLTTAAQAHANDIAKTGNYGHIGSDGSTVFDRVARTEYGSYSWGRRLGENWAWYRDAATTMTAWMNSAPHRNNILHSSYREFGIGIAPSKNSNLIFVVDFGAQPNILPVFINDLATETRTRNVILTLSTEDVMPSGDGAATIGRAVDVQISNSIDFESALWNPLTVHIPWILTEGVGKKTVYVKYRDSRGRIAMSWATIRYTSSNTPTLLPILTATRTSLPTWTATESLALQTPIDMTPIPESAGMQIVLPEKTSQTPIILLVFIVISSILVHAIIVVRR